MSKEMRKIIDNFLNFNKPSNIWVDDFKKENPHIKETLIPLSFLYNKIKKWDNEHYEKNIWDKVKVDKMVVVKAELFPPILLEKNTNKDEYVVVDGWHRLSAAVKRGDSEIKALVKNVSE